MTRVFMPKSSKLPKNKVFLITGGTGSFGKHCAKMVLDLYEPAKVIIFSRDELKQYEMQQNGYSDDRLRFFIGDVRDKDRLTRAMHGVDYVIHAAALKQVASCEYNPMEAILTNVIGTKNVIEAAIDAKVAKVIALSTDKACNPINLYGATKLCAEKLVIHSNCYSGLNGARFSCVRYGNVVGSRGSVIPVFLKQRDGGTLTITDKRMTRFWITLDQGAHFVLDCLSRMAGGEVFVPKIPSMNVVDLAAVIAPNCKIKTIGIRPGEKLHETLISEDDARHVVEYDDRFVIAPLNSSAENSNHTESASAPCSPYTSDNNTQWLASKDLVQLLEQTIGELAFPKPQRKYA